MTESSITCPRCRMTSHHPKDVEFRYCGNCHQFHDYMSVPVIGRDLERQMRRVKTSRHVVEIGLTLAMTGVIIWVAEGEWIKALFIFVPWVVCFVAYLVTRRIERSVTGR